MRPGTILGFFTFIRKEGRISPKSLTRTEMQSIPVKVTPLLLLQQLEQSGPGKCLFPVSHVPLWQLQSHLQTQSATVMKNIT